MQKITASVDLIAPSFAGFEAREEAEVVAQLHLTAIGYVALAISSIPQRPCGPGLTFSLDLQVLGDYNSSGQSYSQYPI